MAFTERSNINTINVKISSQSAIAFVDWQAKFNAEIAAFPDFVSLEIISSDSQEPQMWSLIQRFDTPAGAEKWRASPKKANLIHELESIAFNHEIKEVTSREWSAQNGITEVIITQVAPEHDAHFRAWMAKIHHTEAKFPGFRGVYVQSPMHGHGRNWITLLQFDTAKNLNQWLTSKERKKILEECSPFISSMESHRMISPYAGWFSSIANIGEIPSVWKQTMLVLLMLFPIVMLEIKYLMPSLKSYDISISTFIGNAISVTLLAWPMMPIAIGCLRWWLVPEGNHRSLVTVLGTILILFFYMLEVMFFWNFI